MKVFKKLHINIPFANAREQMLSYVKFMKDIFVNKRKLVDYETIALKRNVVPFYRGKCLKNLKILGASPSLVP